MLETTQIPFIIHVPFIVTWICPFLKISDLDKSSALAGMWGVTIFGSCWNVSRAVSSTKIHGNTTKFRPVWRRIPLILWNCFRMKSRWCRKSFRFSCFFCEGYDRNRLWKSMKGTTTWHHHHHHPKIPWKFNHWISGGLFHHFDPNSYHGDFGWNGGKMVSDGYPNWKPFTTKSFAAECRFPPSACSKQIQRSVISTHKATDLFLAGPTRREFQGSFIPNIPASKGWGTLIPYG